MKNLAARGQSRLRKTKTLANSINTLFTEKLDEPDLMSLIQELETQEYISISKGNVSYKLPQ